jgi:hypothetical protein
LTLGVDDQNALLQPRWGKTGHYTIASLATTAGVTSAGLAALLQANTDRVSFALEHLDHTTIDDRTRAAEKAGTFMPLADVPDLIWKNVPSRVAGGRDTGPNQGPEHPCHFADIDEPRPSDGKTLREICIADPANVAVPVWQEYYSSLGHAASASRGLLPFRVWQFFDAMADAVRHRDVDAYLAAAGLVAHYVGDASQPLHGSFLSNGVPGAGHRTGVHSAYESTMVDRHDADILQGLLAQLKTGDAPASVTTGGEAAVAVVELMDRTAARIAPRDLVDAYTAVAAHDGDASAAVTDALWARFGTATVANLADSVRVLAMVWESAWTSAGGDTAIEAADLVARPVATLQKLYQDPGFVPSLDLDHVGSALRP